MAERIDQDARKRAQQLAQKVVQERKPKTREETVLEKARVMAQQRGLTPNVRNQTPNASAIQSARSRVNLSAPLGVARNFQEYAGLRKKQEQEESMQAAAQKLLGQYGYQNIAGKAVFVSPFSPLPRPTAENTANRMQAPGAYGIKPQDYAGALSAIDRFQSMKAPETPDVKSDFIEKWFGGTAETPNMTDVLTTGDNLPKDQQEAFWADFANFQNAVDQGWKHDAQQTKYQRDYEEAKAQYDAAIELLGEDAPDYATGNAADYYERYRNTQASHAQNNDKWFDRYQARSQFTDAISYEDAAYIENQDSAIQAPGGLKRWSQTTQQERELYTYLQEMYGYQAAKSYIESLYPELNRRLVNAESEAARKFAEEHPVRASAGTVFSAPTRGIGMMGVAADTIMDRDVDVYDPRLNNVRRDEAIRETVSEDMSGVGSFFYNSGMSMGDNLMNMLAWGGLGKAGTLTSMGFSSAGSAYVDAVDRGASHEDAMLAAAASGAAEMLFEQFSLDNVIKMANTGDLAGFIGNVFKQMGIEGSEEMLTAVANEMTDRAIMYDQSNYQIAVRGYMAQGMDEAAARRQANRDAAVDIGLSTLGGMFSGTVMGAGSQYAGYRYNRSRQRTAQQREQQAETPVQPAAAVRQAEQTEPARPSADERDVLMREYQQAVEEEQTKTRQEAPVQPEKTTQQPWRNVDQELRQAAQQLEQEHQREAQREKEQPVRGQRPEPKRSLFGRRQAVQPTETREQRLARKRPEMMGHVQQRVQAANQRLMGAPYATEKIINPYIQQEQEAQQTQNAKTEQQPARPEYTEQKSTEPETAEQLPQEQEKAEHTKAEQAEKTASSAAENNKAQMFRTARNATVRDEYGAQSRVRVVGVMMDDGVPKMVTENENGETDYALADELTFDDAVDELLNYENVASMDAKGLRNYLEGYNAETATAQEYAEAYNTVYHRAKSGLDYNQAAMENPAARRYLTEETRMSAYSAGLNAYNQGHDTGSAEIVSEAAEADAGQVSYSIKEENGQKYVDVDTDQDFFDGVTGNAALEKAKQYIVEHFKNKYIGEGSARSHVTRHTANEYAHPAARNSMTDETKTAKARASAELDNLLSASEFMEHVDDDGRHKEAVNGWDHYRTIFRVGGLLFEARVNILKGNGYQRLYDITQIKNVDGVYGLSGQSQNAISSIDTNSIAQNARKGKGKLSIQYTTQKWNALGTEGKRKAIAQMELLAALATRSGKTIAVVDRIDTSDGGTANASYDSENGIIKVALDADEGAYAYAAMHELTHAMRNEHSQAEWNSFVSFVKEALTQNGQSWDVLVQYQMDRFGYSLERAEEEVVCNTAPAMLQDESNLLKLYKGNRTLFERVVDWVRGLLKDIQTAGKALSQRSRSWVQMDALKNDRQTLQEMYDRMMAIMEKPAENREQDAKVVKLSAKDDSDAEVNSLKEQLRANADAINKLPTAASVITQGRQGRSDAQLTKAILDEYKASGYEVERQGFGKVSFGEREVDKAVHYANNDAEFAAILAAKKVVKRGVEINDRRNHKNRRYDSTTFAAPVEVNGKTGIVAVLVKKTKGNRFAVARILAPDGTAFVFEYEKDAESTTGGGRPATEAAAVYTPIDSASDNSIAENEQKVKYSLRDTDENVHNALSAQQEAFQQVRGHRITDEEAAKLAKMMLKESNSTFDEAQLQEEIKRIFNYVEQGESINQNQIEDEMTSLAARVMEDSKTKDLEHEEMAKPIRKYLKNTAMRLTEKQKDEASNMMGTYRAYSNRLFGHVRLTSAGGKTLDSLWGELHNLSPELFPQDASEGDMPGLLMQAVDATKPVYHTNKGMNVEEAATWLAGKLKEGYFDLKSVKDMAKDRRTFGDSIRELKTAMKSFEEKSWEEYQAALKQLEKEVKEKLPQSAKEIAAVRAKYRTWRERDTAARKERETKTKYRAQIERMTNDIVKRMEKPTDKKHVKAGLDTAVMTFLEGLKLDNNQRTRDLSSRIQQLHVALTKAQKATDRQYLIDPDLLEDMNTMSEKMNGLGSMNELTADQMHDMRDMVKAVIHIVNTADKMFAMNKNVTAAQVAQRSIDEMNRKKDKKQREGFVGMVDDMMNNGMLDSFRFFDRLGGAAREVFQAVRDGLDVKVRLVTKAIDYVEEYAKNLDKDLTKGKKAKKTTYEVSGGKIELSKAQIMELYCLSKRDQAKAHLYDGGIRTEKAVSPVKITEADVEKITGTLTDAERKLADALQSFMASECAEWGNQTSMTLYGYRKFGEKNYYPIDVDKNTTQTMQTEAGQEENLYAIMNMGMTKTLKEGANNALIIGDIFDTFSRHVDNMSTYRAYAAPVSDMLRWFNWRSVEGDGASVKTTLEKKFGAKGRNYITTLIRDLNGQINSGYSTGIMEKMTQKAKSASVGANVRVAIQQPTAIARAADMMSPKYILAGLTMSARQIGKAIKLAQKYCPIAKWKSMGFYDTHIGKGLREMLFGGGSAMDSLTEKSMWLAGKMDEVTWGALWRACEKETKAKHPDLTDEALYEATGKRLAEIIDYTQVVDTPLHRSQLMRSKNYGSQMITAFMGEPVKTYNMLQSAISKFAENRRDPVARARVGRMMIVYLANVVLNAAAQSVWDAVRDDDDEEAWLDKFMTALLGDYEDAETAGDYLKAGLDSNLVGGLNPLSMIPLVNDIISMVQGYDPSRMDLQAIDKLIQIVEEIGKLTRGESEWSGYKWIRSISSTISYATGVPFENLIRDTVSIYNTVSMALGGDSVPTQTETATASYAYENMYDAMLDGNEDKWNRIEGKLKGDADSPKSNADIDAGIGKLLSEDDERIAQAWEAKEAGKASEMNRIRQEIVDGLAETGVLSVERLNEIVDKAIATYGASVTPKEEEEEKDTEKPLKVRMYETKDAVQAIRGVANGTVSQTDAIAILSELIADSEAKDPEASVKSSIQSELKKDYLAMEAKGNTSGMKKLAKTMESLLGTKQETMDSWVADQHSANLRSAAERYDSTAARRAIAVMRRDGKTDSQIKNSLSSFKEQYVTAVKSRDTRTVNKMKTFLKGLGLKGKNGDPLYDDQTFADWMK